MGWSVGMAPAGAGRYTVFLLDRQFLALRRPDGGDEHQDYTADELRLVLRDRYGLSEVEITERIAAADHEQAVETWSEAHRAALRSRPTGMASTEVLAAYSALCTAEEKPRAARHEAVAKVQGRAG